MGDFSAGEMRRFGGRGGRGGCGVASHARADSIDAGARVPRRRVRRRHRSLPQVVPQVVPKGRPTRGRIQTAAFRPPKSLPLAPSPNLNRLTSYIHTLWESMCLAIARPSAAACSPPARREPRLGTRRDPVAARVALDIVEALRVPGEDDRHVVCRSYRSQKSCDMAGAQQSKKNFTKQTPAGPAPTLSGS